VLTAVMDGDRQTDKSGSTVERRDQVLIGRLSFEAQPHRPS
jgi:hypothetical protein